MLSPTSKPDGRSTRLSQTHVIPAKAGIQWGEERAARLFPTSSFLRRQESRGGEGRTRRSCPFKVRANAPLSGRRLPATSGGGGYSASEGYN